MAKIIVAIIVCFGLYITYDRVYNEAPKTTASADNTEKSVNTRRSTSPYIDIYGRRSCGNTSALTQYLDAQKIPYKFHSIDRPNALKKVSQMLNNAGHDGDRFTLPVVDVNGKVSPNPKRQDVLSDYRKG